MSIRPREANAEAPKPKKKADPDKLLSPSEISALEAEATALSNDNKLFKQRAFDEKLSDDQRAQLLQWFKKYPQLAEAYDLKEQFMDIWRARSPADARVLINQWTEAVAASGLKDAFKKACETMDRRKKEILAHFVHNRITNALTEATNGIVKITNRMGRGYDFPQIRARALWGRRASRTRTRAKPP